MRAEYKRDMNHNYLILQGDALVDTSSYQVRMLAGNAIPSLLKCRIQGLDGKLLFYYEITSKQSVADLFEKKKLHAEDLNLIFGSFVRVMEEMTEYLLNPGQLVLSPEHMYLDAEKQELFFCYLPGFEKGVKEQFQSLTEYILPKLDHEDNKAVILGYGIYRRALEERFHLEYIKEELYQTKEQLPESVAVQPPEKKEMKLTFPEKEETMEEDFWSREELSGNKKEEEKKQEKKKKEKKNQGKQEKKNIEKEKREKISEAGKLLPGCFIGAGVVLLLLAVKVNGYLPWLGIEVMAGGVLALAGLGTLIYLLLEKKHKNEKEEIFKNTVRSYEDLKIAEYDEPEITERKHSQPEIAEQPNVPLQENYGETVVLSANPITGPSSLVSREPGELAPIYLTEDLMIIGKLSNASDAVIDLPTVSRVHARIRKREGEYYLTDLNSRNGTSVNGRLLKGDEEYQLQNEDEVDFAQARYIFLK